MQPSLNGPAFETIAGLPISNSNYKEAIDLLQKCYGNKQILISKFVETLLALPATESSNDLQLLRCLYDRTEVTVRSLRGVGVSDESYGTILTPIITAKVPRELHLILSRDLSNEWDLSGLLDISGKEQALQEKCSLAPLTNPASSKTSHNKTQVKPKQGAYMGDLHQQLLPHY